MRKIFDCLISRFNLRRIKNEGVKSYNIDSAQFTLIPLTIDKKIEIKDGDSIKIEDNKAYQPVIDIAGKLNDREVKNIAITGPFGSGKSSVLRTLRKDFPQFNYLSISLATLECNKEKQNIEQEPNKEQTKTKNRVNTTLQTENTNQTKLIVETSNESTESEESLNQKIEYSILQQLIYKEKSEDIPQSRFKRIKHISTCKSYEIAFGFVIFFISICILFEPNFLKIESFYNLFSCSKKWKILWDSLSLLYISAFTILILSKLIIKTYNNRLNKLNLKDGEIEINESTSIFNKHLDEIIYFFEVTNYDVVIIEDLDRFDNPKIFLKLRELNYLLNNSKAISRQKGNIVFIYAIRDDMFKDTSRTKFFDYITTVIPVINTSNSRDQLLRALKQQGVTDISDDTCMDLGVYIDDMRILLNIVNEYIQYRFKLQDNLSPQKMLGMILYKNYHPDDFVKLQNKDGIVYKIISNRVKYHNSNVTEKDKKIEDLKKEKKTIQDYYLEVKAKELRAIYVMKYFETNQFIQYFRENRTNNYSLTQLIEKEDLFQKLENNVFTHFYNDFQGEQKLNLKFRDIEKKVDQNYSYRERLNQLPQRVAEIDNEIQKIQSEIAELRTLPLGQILNKYSAFDFYEDTQKNKLIAFLIRAGYIDESYYDYISYFYPGVMTPSDRDFILNLKIGLTQDYNYKIYKTKAVVSDIHESLFSKIEILNIFILDFIVENKNEYPLQYISLKNNIKKHEAFEFVATYYVEGKNSDLFFKDILTTWPAFFPNAILKPKSHKLSDICFSILLQHFPKAKIDDFKQNKQFKNYISDRFEFILAKLDIIEIAENIKFLTESLELKFKNLGFNNSILEESLMFSKNEELTIQNITPKDLFLFLVDGHYYSLTNENIKIILKLINPMFVLEYDNASYTTILKSGNDNLINYINKNIEECFYNIFPETSINESEETIKSILNIDIEEESKIDYLKRQTNRIDLNDLSEDYWNVAISSNVVTPTWQNIEEYISIEANKNFNPMILDFISNNSSELSTQKTNKSVSESTDSNLFIKLIGDNVLTLDAYKKISKSFNRIFRRFDLSNLHPDRFEFLIENHFIELNKDNFKLTQEKFPGLLFKLLSYNKSEYIPNIHEYSIDAITTFSILQSDRLNNLDKVKIIETIPSPFYENNSKLANLTCSILNSANKVLGNFSYVIQLMSNATDEFQKLSIFIRECIESKYDKNFVKLGLILLKGDYEKIALQRGHRRKFADTKENRILAEYLEKNRFISSITIKDGKIKMNARDLE